MLKFSLKDIESRLKLIITEITGYTETLLTLETCIIPDENAEKVIGVGSLELAELLIAIDETFGVNIPDEEVLGLKTLKHFVEYIYEEHLKES